MYFCHIIYYYILSLLHYILLLCYWYYWYYYYYYYFIDIIIAIYLSLADDRLAIHWVFSRRFRAISFQFSLLYDFHWLAFSPLIFSYFRFSLSLSFLNIDIIDTCWFSLFADSLFRHDAFTLIIFIFSLFIIYYFIIITLLYYYYYY